MVCSAAITEDQRPPRSFLATLPEGGYQFVTTRRRRKGLVRGCRVWFCRVLFAAGRGEDVGRCSRDVKTQDWPAWLPLLANHVHGKVLAGDAAQS